MTTKSQTHLLIVDDDPGLCDLLSQYLQKQGFEVDAVDSGNTMDAYLSTTKVDLIILDLMLPGEDGLSIAKRLNRDYRIPVIMLSASGEDVDRIIGLEVGADDYLAKPFNPRELLARIRAVLRRHTPADNQDSQDTRILTFGPYQLDTVSQNLERNGEAVTITSGDFALLSIFLKNINRVLTRDMLLEQLKGYECLPFDRSVDVRVMRLRQKIEVDTAKPKYIRTVWGEGYKFVIPTTNNTPATPA